MEMLPSEESEDFQELGILESVLCMQNPIFDETDTDKSRKMICNHLTNVIRSTKSFAGEDFGADMEWLNTSKSLSMKNDFMNRVIILDFFTYCCINCIHILPFLKSVEEKFQENSGLSVIGVHSAKFSNEKSLNNVKDAILRNDIKHPVVNDSENILWSKFCITCWPTVLIIGPSGHILFALVGEGQVNKLLFLCTEVLSYLQMNNIPLNTSHLPLKLLKETIPSCYLLYPASVCSDDGSNIIIVSDTGHNQLLVLSRYGQILDVVGNGKQGFKDGTFKEALFNSPRGAVWKKPNFVFVADTGNHCIRLINLKLKLVQKLYGFPIGKNENISNEDLPNHTTHFFSPWDICLGQHIGSDSDELNCLYIALAGSHQIWILYLEDYNDSSSQPHKVNKCEVFAGNGKEENRNNSYRLQAAFAQPSGITFSKLPPFLYVADSESSTVRSISLVNGSVKTVVGGGLDPMDLFQFGDRDGKGIEAKLQHPMGVFVHQSTCIFVSDSYNHKIKMVNPETRICKAYAGSGVCGNKVSGDLMEVEFNEPGGLCGIDDGKFLFVADTNNHCIKIINVENQTVSVLPISAPKVPLDTNAISIISNAYSIVEGESEVDTLTDEALTKVSITPGGQVRCKFSIQVNENFMLTEGAPQPWKISISGNDNLCVMCQSNTLFNPDFQPSLILKNETTGMNRNIFASKVFLDITLYFCEIKNKTCFSRTVRFKFHVEISNSGLKSADVHLACLVN